MGKKGHELSKALRQELILQILHFFSNDSGITTSEVYEILDNKCPGINRRTVHRDLIELSTTFPVFDEFIDGKSKWFFSKDSGKLTETNLYREFIQKQLSEYLKRKKEKDFETFV